MADAPNMPKTRTKRSAISAASSLLFLSGVAAACASVLRRGEVVGAKLEATGLPSLASLWSIIF